MSRRPPARWRWTSKAKIRRELWRGPLLMASVTLDCEFEICPGGGDRDVWVWRVIGAERWGYSSSREASEREAKALAVAVELAALLPIPLAVFVTGIIVLNRWDQRHFDRVNRALDEQIVREAHRLHRRLGITVDEAEARFEDLGRLMRGEKRKTARFTVQK